MHAIHTLNMTEQRKKDYQQCRLVSSLFLPLRFVTWCQFVLLFHADAYCPCCSLPYCSFVCDPVLSILYIQSTAPFLLPFILLKNIEKQLVRCNPPLTETRPVQCNVANSSTIYTRSVCCHLHCATFLSFAWFDQHFTSLKLFTRSFFHTNKYLCFGFDL